MEIKIPPTVKDMRLKHLPFVTEIAKIAKEFPEAKTVEALGLCISITDIVRLNSLFTGIDEVDFRRCSVDGNRDLFRQIMLSCNEYKPEPLPTEIEIEGKKFWFVSDFTKLPAGWFIDVDSINIQDQPEYLPAFCFLEEGMGYAVKDNHKNIVNPLKPRAELFKEHLPLNLFMDLQGFFLDKWKILEPLQEIQRVKVELKNLGAGRTPYT